jgi:tetratricopeptide (TPR) repeat protein
MASRKVCCLLSVVCNLSSDLSKRLCAASLGRTRALNHLAQREAQHAELSRLREWVAAADDEAIATDSAIEHAAYYTATTQWAEAGHWVDEALLRADRLQDKRRKFRAADVAYQAMQRQFKNAEGTEFAQRMLALAEALNDAAAKADALAALCEIRSLMGQFEEASGYGQRAVQLFQLQNNLIGEARGATALGDLYLRTSDFGRARANLQRAMTLYTELNFKSKYAHCANALGAAEYWLGNFPAALDLYESGLKSAREANDRWYIAYTLTNIGELYYDIGEMALAGQNQREAVGVAQEINFKWVEGYARCYLGRICAHNKQFTLSIDEARKAVQCMEDSNNADNWYFCQSRLALCCLDSGDLAAASNEVDVMLARLQMVMPRKVHLQAAQNAAYAVRKAQGRLPEARQHICQAEAALLGQASELPPDAREKFLKFARLNQETLKAIKAESRVVQQKLLRLDGTGYATVNWTLHHPNDDALAHDARRRAVRQRLADEAAAQGARATDEDLGDAVA